jgi:probable HAF family extracellular repeat protein
LLSCLWTIVYNTLWLAGFSLFVAGEKFMKHVAFVTVLVVLLAAARSVEAVTYKVTDLGTLGGASSSPAALNDQGQVVGSSLTASGQTHAFLYTGGVMTDLGTLAGQNYSRAQDINNAGNVVGASLVEDSQGNLSGNRPFIYSGGTMTNIGSLGGGYGFANGIDSSGRVTGLSARADAVTHAFRYVGGVMMDLGDLSNGNGYSDGYSINDAGDVAGVSVAATGERGFLWHNGIITDLGDLPGGPNSSSAYKINNQNQVVGESGVSGAVVGHAFVWQNGVMTDLQTLSGFDSSYAVGINDFGTVVGTSYQPGVAFGRSSDHAFVWDALVGLQDLNQLLDGTGNGWTISIASDINSSGQIVGLGFNPAGDQHGFLLTPVPEPSTIVIYGLTMLIAGAAYGKWKASLHSRDSGQVSPMVE